MNMSGMNDGLCTNVEDIVMFRLYKMGHQRVGRERPLDYLSDQAFAPIITVFEQSSGCASRGAMISAKSSRKVHVGNGMQANFTRLPFLP